MTADAFAWGAAIGAAALLATGAATSAGTRLRPLPAMAAAFGLAFLAYEGVLFAATALLSSGPDAFSLPVIGRILGIDLLALTGLMVLHRIAATTKLVIDRQLYVPPAA